MKIEKVKATKNGWLVNNKFACGFDYSEETFAKELAKWFLTNKAEPLHTKEEKLKITRFRKLEEIFLAKVYGLKAIAIDEPWTSNTDFIDAQNEVYEDMYQNSLIHAFDIDTNSIIIKMNEEAKALVAPLSLLVNSIKSALRAKIEADDADVDAMLDVAERFKLEKSEINATKIAEIKKVFGV